MISILGAMGIGFLLSLIGLDDLFNNVLGFSERSYYLMWFLMGTVVWLRNLFSN